MTGQAQTFRWLGAIRFLGIVAGLAATVLAGLVAQPAVAAEPLQAREYKMAGDDNRMRVVMQFDREPEPKWFLLRGPHRLVIDFAETEMTADPRELKARGMIEDVRFGNVGEGTLAADPGRQGTVRGRASWTCWRTRRRPATAWWPTWCRRPKAGSTAALAEQAADDGVDRRTAGGRRGRAA